YIVKPDPKASKGRPVTVVRLNAGDNPDPEPGGWRRLAVVMHNTAKTELTVTDLVKPGEGKLLPLAGPTTVAHLTGTEKFKLSPDAQKEIKDFVAKGGTLVVDAAGADGVFADAAEAELGAVFGAAPGAGGEVLPPEHAVY